jgi:competence ComEA-like helix-hairpin-helix protein
MPWLHRLQQRLSITKNEALTLLSLSFFLMVGVTGRHVCRRVPVIEPDAYAELDSIFSKQSSIAFEAEERDRRTGAVADSIIPLITPLYASEDSSGAVAGGPLSIQSLKIQPPDDRPEASHTTEESTSRMIDLNLATASDLEQLPRIGPKIAKRILAFRDAFGPLRSVDELLSVRGIGAKTLDLIRPHVHVSSQDTTG